MALGRQVLDGVSGFFERRVQAHPPSFAKSLGVGLLFAFGLQIITGVTLGATYAPTTTDAWGSLYILETRTLFGSFVRGLHHFGASAVVILSVLHMTQVVVSGAYQRPRSRNWILGVVMLFLVLGLALTGYLLPWDQHGYWSTRVAVGIIGEAPMGGLLQTLLLGGDSYGNATLSRFFALHTYVLPGALALLTLFHVGSYLKHGPRVREPAAGKAAVAGDPTPPTVPARTSLPYFPYQLVRDVVVMLLIFATLAALALLVGARLEAPADPASDFEARPEWYFLFLYQLLQFFEGPLVLVGTTILPALAALFLIAIPFIDRKRRERGQSSPSPLVRFGFLGLLTIVGGLTTYAIVNDATDERFQKSRERSNELAARAIALADLGGVDGLGRVVLLKGLELYHDKGCASCHEDPKVAAPRLKGYGTVERGAAFIANPDSERFFKGTPFEGEMPASGLAPEDNLALAAWLMHKEAPADRIDRARKLFISQDCTICHNDPEAGVRHKAYDPKLPGPDLEGWQSYEWTRGLLRDATHPSYFGDVLTDAAKLSKAMPPYPDLTPDELDLLTTWLLAGAPESKL